MTRTSSAFSLVEVVISIGILSFCMVLLLGLLPVGIKTNELSSEETKALNLMTAVVSDLKHTPRGLGETPIFGLPLPPFSLENVVGKTNGVYFTEGWEVQKVESPKPNSRYHVSWWYNYAPESGALGGVEGVIRVSWPARPKDKNSKWDASTEVYVTFSKPYQN